jgi:hypothetical protein
VSDFEIGGNNALRREGSTFAFGIGPRSPAFGDGRTRDRILTAERAGPWTFVSRCGLP